MTPKTTPIDPRTNESYKHRFVTQNRAELWWIEQARKDPLMFMWYLTELKPAAHHIQWVRAILENRNVNIIAPRESGKTTVLVYLMAWLIAKNPLGTNFIGSVSAKQAEDRLDMIRGIVEHNSRFHNVFPHILIDQKRNNNKSEFNVWCDDFGNGEISYGTYRSIVTTKGDLKNPTLYCCGIGSSGLIGRRISSLALIDDIHSEANSATEYLRDKVDDWFNRTFLPCVKGMGKIAVICTRWAETDQSGRLMALRDRYDRPIWVTIDIPAILPNGESYWPELWTIEILEDKRDEVGEVMFRLMYLNDPLGLASGQFNMDNLRHPLPDPLPEFRSVVVSTDLAITTKTYSDYVVFTAMARDDKRHYDIYVLDMVRDKMTFNEALDRLARFCDEVFELFGKLDAVLFENQALSIPSAEELKERRTDLPIRKVPIKGDKMERLSPVAIKAQRGGMFVNIAMKDYKAMCSELIAFPRSAHDDIVDAVSLPLQFWGAHELTAGTVEVSSPYLL